MVAMPTSWFACSLSCDASRFLLKCLPKSCPCVLLDLELTRPARCSLICMQHSVRHRRQHSGQSKPKPARALPKRLLLQPRPQLQRRGQPALHSSHQQPAPPRRGQQALPPVRPTLRRLCRRRWRLRWRAAKQEALVKENPRLTAWYPQGVPLCASLAPP